jgi:DNA-binding SARP family transcriptional activator/tetratricopeptide (TPR) repeat protein
LPDVGFVAALPPPMTAIRLELSNRALLHAGSGALVLNARDAALLAWLAIEGPTTRGRVAALLWPAISVEEARSALRQRLFQLKKQAGVAVVTGDGVLALAECVTHDLQDGGTLLAGLTNEYGAEFSAWLTRERARREGRSLHQLAARIDAAEQAREYAQALALANEAVALDPMSEVAHRRVIRLHYLNGDRPAALLAFDRCAQMLAEEVGSRPSAETLALLHTISAADDLTPSTAHAVPAGVLLPPRMIGRDVEFALLQHGWAAGQVVAVIGEAGLGKTRLMQAFAQTRRDVTGAAARPGDAGVPFATLARLLRAVMEHADAIRPLDDRLPAGTRQELARVLPELEAAPPRAPGEGQRLIMQRALRSLLDAQSGLSGLLVDDLHFADEASLELLRALMDDDVAGEGHRPLRWALAYRPADSGSPVQALHDALVERARVTPVLLQPLDEAALAALVDSLGLPGVLGAALAPGLSRRTGGNPLFVLETLKQAWVERKLEQLSDPAALPRPVSVGRLIERRLAQLSPGALALARVASIAGADFSIALAERVLHASAMQFADALNELESAQVMRGNAFAHDLVFDAVRASVPSSIAAHTHASVAAHLEPKGAEPARIAQHWIDAGQPERAIDWLQRAADRAQAGLRGKECTAFLERKSAIEEAAGDREGAFDSQLAAAAMFSQTVRDPAVGLEHCDRLLRLADTPGQLAEALLQRADLLKEIEPERAAADSAEALRHAVTLGDARLQAVANLSLATALVVLDRLDEAVQHYERCSAWIDAHGSLDDRSNLHGSLGVVYDNLGRLDAAMPHHEQGYRASIDGGSLGNAATAQSNMACNRLDAGDLAAARAHLEQGLTFIALHDEYRAGVGSFHAMLALIDCQDGRYADALLRAQTAADVMERYAAARAESGQLRLAEVWSHLGQWSRVRRIIESPTLVGTDKAAARTHAALLRHRLQRALDRPGGDELAQALAALPTGVRPDLRMCLLIEQADVLAPAAALSQLGEVIAQALAIQHEGTALAAHVRAAGIAAVTDPGAAVHHARAALALMSRRQSVVILPAERWLHTARALMAGGERAEADALLAHGRDWLHSTAREHVPAEFRDSFLNRNPVNRDLLRLAARVPAGA